VRYEKGSKRNEGEEEAAAHVQIALLFRLPVLALHTVVFVVVL